MGASEAIFWAAVSLTTVVGIPMLVWYVRVRIQDRRTPRDLSDTIAERLAAAREVNGAPVIGVPIEVWNLDGRHATGGDTWPDHDEDADEDGCWCRTCYEVEISLMQDREIGELFAGLVDTPELRDLADRARRYIR